MRDYDIDELCRDLEKQIADAPICEPTDGEFIGECPWSRTNWAIWEGIDGGRCTCRPALPPTTLTKETGK